MPKHLAGSTDTFTPLALGAHPDGALSIRDLTHQIDRELQHQIEDALLVLSYHGVINDHDDPDRPQIASTLFRDWYQRHGPEAEPATVPDEPRALRVFYCYLHR